MAAKFTRLTHKIATQLHLVVQSWTICSSRSRWSVWKLLYTTSYFCGHFITNQNYHVGYSNRDVFWSSSQ